MFGIFRHNFQRLCFSCHLSTSFSTRLPRRQKICQLQWNIKSITAWSFCCVLWGLEVTTFLFNFHFCLMRRLEFSDQSFTDWISRPSSAILHCYSGLWSFSHQPQEDRKRTMSGLKNDQFRPSGSFRKCVGNIVLFGIFRSIIHQLEFRTQLFFIRTHSRQFARNQGKDQRIMSRKATRAFRIISFGESVSLCRPFLRFPIDW